MYCAAVADINLKGLIAAMTPEQVMDLGWDRKLPTSLAEFVTELQHAVEAHTLDALRADFLKMYIDFKKLEADQAEKKSEAERLEVMSKVF